MNEYHSRQSGSLFAILALVVTLLGMRASSVRAGAPASANSIPKALSTLITTTTRVSISSSGAQANDYSNSPSISADGRYVAFGSLASSLVSGDTNNVDDIFLRDTQTNTTTRISLNSSQVQGNDYSFSPSISANGRYVAFVSFSTNLVSGDTNIANDVFVRDTQANTTTRVSVDSTGNQGNGWSEYPSISADGRFVTFGSSASNLVSEDTNNAWDIFVHDMQSGATTRLSVNSSGTQGDQGNSLYCPPAISADGRYVAFQSIASNLVSGDTIGSQDIFLRDRQMAITTRVSVGPSGEQATDWSYCPSISADGRFVGFSSDASNLVSADTNYSSDGFVHDMQTGATVRVSVSSGGTQGDESSYSPFLSADGRYVAFQSYASNLVSGDGNSASDIFVHDMQTGTTARLSLDSSGAQVNDDSYSPVISGNGLYVAFDSGASKLVGGDTNDVDDIFVVPATIYTLTVNKTGAGSGTVTSSTSSPAGITCGAVCAYAFTSGTTIGLSAAPNSGSHFTGWSGGGCTGKGICTLTMTADTLVTARFDLDINKIFLPLLVR